MSDYRGGLAGSIIHTWQVIIRLSYRFILWFRVAQAGRTRRSRAISVNPQDWRAFWLSGAMAA